MRISKLIPVLLVYSVTTLLVSCTDTPAHEKQLPTGMAQEDAQPQRAALDEHHPVKPSNDEVGEVPIWSAPGVSEHELFARAPIVIRGIPSNLGRTMKISQMEILRVLKNESGQDLRGPLTVRYVGKSLEDLPAEICTAYLSSPDYQYQFNLIALRECREE